PRLGFTQGLSVTQAPATAGLVSVYQPQPGVSNHSGTLTPRVQEKTPRAIRKIRLTCTGINPPIRPARSQPSLPGVQVVISTASSVILWTLSSPLYRHSFFL